MMRLRRTLIIGAAIVLSALAILGVGNSSGVNGPRTDTVGQHQITLAAVTAGTESAGQEVLPPLGPIPCLDGSTVDLGQFCPLPTIQCANGTTVPVGQFCPVTTATTAAQAPPPPAAPVTCPDGSAVQPGQSCPTPKPAPPPPPVSTVFVCGAGYHYEAGQCVRDGPIVN